MSATSDVCLVCGGTKARHSISLRGGHIVACVQCGFQFVHPTPTPAQLADYYDRQYVVPLARAAHNPARYATRLAEVEHWQPQRGRLLEVGCSYGYGLVAARERDWQVAGVELSPTAAQYARTQFGLDVFSGDVLDAVFDPGSFDAAVLWHVLEHTHDPGTQLDRLHALLRPGGVLGLRVPNARSLGARLAGRSWVWMSPPAHLWYFSAATLPRLLHKHGFAVLNVQTARGEGWNLYQHMLVALGNQINMLIRTIRQRRAPLVIAPHTASFDAPAPLNTTQRTWAALLRAAHPRTDALARATTAFVTPLEAAGLGDELICYARRVDG